MCSPPVAALHCTGTRQFSVFSSRYNISAIVRHFLASLTFLPFRALDLTCLAPSPGESSPEPLSNLAVSGTDSLLSPRALRASRRSCPRPWTPTAPLLTQQGIPQRIAVYEAFWLPPPPENSGLQFYCTYLC